MKTYSNVSTDVETHIDRMRAKFHQDLENVTIGALFAYDMDKPTQVLRCGGYPAAAMVRITSLRERAGGANDAMIIVDRATWFELKGPQRAALIDHELQHLERVKDKKTMQRLVDAIDRPRLRMRKHDRQFGWFDIIAERHGTDSLEVSQAKALLTEARQLYFEFDTAAAA